MRLLPLERFASLASRFGGSDRALLLEGGRLLVDAREARFAFGGRDALVPSLGRCFDSGGLAGELARSSLLSGTLVAFDHSLASQRLLLGLRALFLGLGLPFPQLAVCGCPLQVGFELEQSIVYPAISKEVAGGTELVQEAQTEHGDAREALAEVEKLSPDGRAPTMLSRSSRRASPTT